MLYAYRNYIIAFCFLIIGVYFIFNPIDRNLQSELVGVNKSELVREELEKITGSDQNVLSLFDQLELALETFNPSEKEKVLEALLFSAVHFQHKEKIDSSLRRSLQMVKSKNISLTCASLLKGIPVSPEEIHERFGPDVNTYLRRFNSMTGSSGLK